MTERCAKMLYNGPGAFRGYACGRPAVAVDAKGQPRCKIHSPEHLAKVEAKRKARWAAERAANDAVYAAEKERKRRADAYPRLMEMLESIPNPPISMSPERALEEYERWHNLAIELRSELSGAELIIAIDTSGTQVPKPEDA